MNSSTVASLQKVITGNSEASKQEIKYEGLIPTILSICSKSGHKYWQNEEEQCLIFQWLEFASLHSSQMKNDPQHWKIVMNELNHYLDTRSYLIGYSKTLADIVIYFTLLEKFKCLTPLEKEKYQNVSRWFDHIQRDERIQRENELINFSTIYISNRTAVRH